LSKLQNVTYSKYIDIMSAVCVLLGSVITE